MKTNLSFEEIQRQAGCAWKLKKLGRELAINHPCDMAGPLGDYDASDYARQGETLRAIAIVLGLIGSTPNACINREALDALQQSVEHGVSMLKQDWVEEVLKRTEEGDEMPF